MGGESGPFIPPKAYVFSRQRALQQLEVSSLYTRTGLEVSSPWTWSCPALATIQPEGLPFPLGHSAHSTGTAWPPNAAPLHPLFPPSDGPLESVEGWQRLASPHFEQPPPSRLA